MTKNTTLSWTLNSKIVFAQKEVDKKHTKKKRVGAKQQA